MATGDHLRRHRWSGGTIYGSRTWSGGTIHSNIFSHRWSGGTHFGGTICGMTVLTLWLRAMQLCQPSVLTFHCVIVLFLVGLFLTGELLCLLLLLLGVPFFVSVRLLLVGCGGLMDDLGRFHGESSSACPLCHYVCEDALHFITVCPHLHSAHLTFLASAPPSISFVAHDSQWLCDVVLGLCWIPD